MTKAPTNPPPTVHVLIGSTSPTRWTWEVIDTTALIAGGSGCTSYDQACEQAIAIVHEELDPRAGIRFHHGFQALLRIDGEPREAAWKM